jgi:lipopolysaccharide biosynthesis glycosyltransferase
VDPILVASAVSGDEFALPLGVMIRSLLDHLSPGATIRFLVFERGVGEKQKRMIRAAASGEGVSLEFITPDPAAIAGLRGAEGNLAATYWRLQLTDVLPAECSRVLWLDADLLLRHDIADLWREDVAPYAILAAQDMAVPFLSSRYGVQHYRNLQLPPDAPHFNAGVMLINLDAWRKEDVPRRALDYLRRYRDTLYFMDQEGLNAVLCGRWGRLDPRWNQIASIAGRPFMDTTYLSAEEARLLVEDPWILHFAGDWKPWRMNFGLPPFDEYFRTLDRTPWAGWRPSVTLESFLHSFYHRCLRNILYSVEPFWLGWRKRSG